MTKCQLGDGMFSSLSALVIVTGVIVHTACSGKSPTGPEPAPPPPVPTQAFAEIAGTSPAVGATLRALVVEDDGSNDGDYLRATVKFGITQAQLDEAKKRGEDIAVRICLSEDGETEVKGGCSIRRATNIAEGQMDVTQGFSQHILALSQSWTPEVKKTNFFIVTIGWLQRGDIPLPVTKPLEAFFRQVFPAVFHWNHDWD